MVRTVWHLLAAVDISHNFTLVPVMIEHFEFGLITLDSTESPSQHGS